MPNLPISQLPLALSGQPESLMVIVNYDIVSSGETNSIYFSSLTQQFSGASGSSGTSGTSGESGSSGSSGTSGESGSSGSSGSSGYSGSSGSSGFSGDLFPPILIDCPCLPSINVSPGNGNRGFTSESSTTSGPNIVL